MNARRISSRARALTTVLLSVVLLATPAPAGAASAADPQPPGRLPPRSIPKIPDVKLSLARTATGPLQLPDTTGSLPMTSSVSPTGEYRLSVPLSVPPGRAGMQPRLSLGYGSDGGDGLLGKGWTLDGLSAISRCGKSIVTDKVRTGVSYTSDQFCLDGQRLIKVGAQDGQAVFRTERESFADIRAIPEKWPGEAGPDKFVVRLPDGRVREYQPVTTERGLSVVRFPAATETGEKPRNLFGQGGRKRVRPVWPVARENDRAGNEMRFEYQIKSDDLGLQVAPHRIRYTSHTDGSAAHRYVEFALEARPDPRYTYEAGVYWKLVDRIKEIRMFAPAPVSPPGTGVSVQEVWQYRLRYGPGEAGRRTLLKSIKQCAWTNHCLQAKEFSWDPVSTPAFTSKTLESGLKIETADGAGAGTAAGTGPDSESPWLKVMDLNGDGMDDALYHRGGRHKLSEPTSIRDRPRTFVRMGARSADGVPLPLNLLRPEPWRPESGARTLPMQFSGAQTRPVDVDADGAVDLWTPLLGIADDKVRYTRLRWNADKQWLEQKDSVTGGECVARDRCPFALWLDFDGDGRLDLVDSSAPQDGSGRPGGDYRVYLNKGGTLEYTMYTGIPAGCQVYVADLDGDGRGEFVAQGQTIGAEGEKVCADTSTVVGYAPGSTTLEKTPSAVPVDGGNAMRFPGPKGLSGVYGGDFNGDGLQDTIQPSASLLLWNTGHGIRYAAPAGDFERCDRSKGCDVRVADMNNDGMDDLLYLKDDGIWLLVSDGVGGFGRTRIDTEAGLRVGTSSRATTQLGDFDGDGRTDIVYLTASGDLVRLVQKEGGTDRVTAVSDERSGWERQSVLYSAEWSSAPAGKATRYTCSYPLRCLRSGLIVVRRLTDREFGPDRPHHRKYFYEDPVMHLEGRGFLGFGQVRAWDLERPSETVTTFAHRTRHVDPTTGVAFYPRAMTPRSVRVATPILNGTERIQKPGTANARVIETVVDTIEPRPLNRGATLAVFERRSAVREWEQPVTLYWNEADIPNDATDRSHISGIRRPPDPARESITESEYDDFGNLKKQTQATTGGSALGVDITYDNRTGPWLIGLPRIRRTTGTAPDGTKVTRTVVYRHNELGQTEEVAVEPENPDPDVRATTAFGYDGYGNLVTLTERAGDLPQRVRHMDYLNLFTDAPDERIFLSHSWREYPDEARTPAMWTVTHPALGLPVLTGDTTGASTTTAYDGLGRPVHTQAAGQAAITTTYEPRLDGDDHITGMAVSTKTGGRKEAVHVNAGGLLMRGTVTGFGGETLTTERSYDALGRLRSLTRPGGVSRGTFDYEYDTLDRLLTVKLPDGEQVSHSHEMFRTRTGIPGGHGLETVYDRDGRLSQSKETLDVPGQRPRDVTTYYAYAPFGLVARVNAPGNVVTAFEYDTLGRPVKTTEPDRGVTVDRYNGFGELREQTTAAGTSTFAYDELGRRTRAVTPDGATTYAWDTAPNGLGKIASMTSPDGIVTAYRYDTPGRPVGVDLTDESGATYSVDVTYDADGRRSAIAYPGVPGRSRFTVRYDYNESGYLSSISDASADQNLGRLYTVRQRDKDLALTDASIDVHGIGIHRDHDPKTGRLTSAHAVAEGRGTLYDVDYEYTPAGLVKSRGSADGAVRRAETFEYDRLRRLTKWGLSTGPLDGAASAPVVTGYGYDDAGNLTGITRDGAQVERREYGGPGGTRPHALAKRVLSPGGEIVYGYDGRGRNTTDGNRSVTYTSFDLPKTITNDKGETRFRYDATGSRAKKTGDGLTTLYLNDLYERRTGGDGVTHVFHVPDAEGVVLDVVAREGPGGTAITEPLVSLTDQLGTVTQTLNREAVVGRAYYEPFGGRVAADGGPATSPTGPVTRGFTGHEHDDGLGLINMNGRVYDPAMKRFLTPDPLVSQPARGQSWNPYSYVQNSPLNATDPTGYRDSMAVCTQTGPYEILCVGSPRSEGVGFDKYLRDRNARDRGRGYGGDHDRGGPYGPGGVPRRPGSSDRDGLRDPLSLPSQACHVSCHYGNNNYSGRVSPGSGHGSRNLGYNPSPRVYDGVVYEYKGISMPDVWADRYYFGERWCSDKTCYSVQTERSILHGLGYAVSSALNGAQALVGARAAGAASSGRSAPRGLSAVTTYAAPEGVSVRASGNVLAFESPVTGDAIKAIVDAHLETHPKATVFLGSGLHGTVGGALTEAPIFYKSDVFAMGSKVLVFDMTDAAQVRLFLTAEQVARSAPPGQIISIRGWCFSACTPP